MKAMASFENLLRLAAPPPENAKRMVASPSSVNESSRSPSASVSVQDGSSEPPRKIDSVPPPTTPALNT